MKKGRHSYPKKMRKRTGKFYFNNEKETLSKLGLTPTPGSGSGWIVKEDGENDLVMVQLKSTDSSSYRVDMLDIKKLEYHAQTSNKIPVFLIQFLRQDKIYALIDINDIQDFHKAFELKEAPSRTVKLEEAEEVTRKKVTYSNSAREEFFSETEGGVKRKWRRKK